MDARPVHLWTWLRDITFMDGGHFLAKEQDPNVLKLSFAWRWREVHPACCRCGYLAFLLGMLPPTVSSCVQASSVSVLSQARSHWPVPSCLLITTYWRLIRGPQRKASITTVAKVNNKPKSVKYSEFNWFRPQGVHSQGRRPMYLTNYKARGGKWSMGVTIKVLREHFVLSGVQFTEEAALRLTPED